MEGKCAPWDWLKLFGSFILKVTVSTSFDESSALTINYSLFTFSTNFAFSFPDKQFGNLCIIDIFPSHHFLAQSQQ